MRTCTAKELVSFISFMNPEFRVQKTNLVCKILCEIIMSFNLPHISEHINILYPLGCTLLYQVHASLSIVYIVHVVQSLSGVIQLIKGMTSCSSANYGLIN